MNDAVEFHDSIAQSFGKRYGQSARFAERLDAWREAIDAHVSKESVVMDLGCGPGHLTALAAARAKRVIAVDGSAEMIREATRVCQGVGDVEFRQAMLEDVRASALPPLDAILCSSVMEYVKEPGAVLEQCREALKASGVFVVSVPNGNSWYRWLERISFRLLGRPGYLQYVREVASMRREKERLETAGFRIREVRFYGAAPLLSPVFRMFGARRWSDTLIMMVAERR
jgi:2-polyprenyl-6-hydroxyphenyl methylase/3-demethylubiquinone-9 3-methyltransferase